MALGDQIPERKHVFVGELAVRGDWVVVNVQTNAFWTVRAQKVAYRGEDVWILPLMRDMYPAVAVKIRGGHDRAWYARLLMQFLSTLAWVEDQGYLVSGIGGGSMPTPMARNKESG